MNEQEFDEFYAGSFPRLVGQLYAMTGSFAEAQDCVQEAFVRAWQHRKELAVVASPEAWVRTCAWRLAVSRRQRRCRTRRIRCGSPTDWSASSPTRCASSPKTPARDDLAQRSDSCVAGAT